MKGERKVCELTRVDFVRHHSPERVEGWSLWPATPSFPWKFLRKRRWSHPDSLLRGVVRRRRVLPVTRSSARRMLEGARLDSGVKSHNLRGPRLAGDEDHAPRRSSCRQSGSLCLMPCGTMTNDVLP